MRILAALIALLVAAWGGATWYFSSVLVAFETQGLEEHRAKLGLTLEGLELGAAQELEVAGGAGMIRGWWFPAAGPAKCAVILHHGHSANRWGGLEYAPLFSGRGCDIVAYDARAHAESDGAFGTYGYHERDDARAVIAWIADERGLKRSQIGLFGESMGAVISLLAAADEPGLAFVAADAPFESLPSIVDRQAGEQYGWFVQRLLVPGAMALAGWRADADLAAVSPVDAAADLKLPVYLGHSVTDEYTPSSHSEAIFAAIPHARKVLHLNEWGAAHAQDINADPEAYKDQIGAFLDEHAPAFAEVRRGSLMDGPPSLRLRLPSVTGPRLSAPGRAPSLGPKRAAPGLGGGR